ncbi:hypothetical protein ACFX1Q_008299 [Malus domestica]
MEEPPTQSFLYETLPALSLPTLNQSPPPPDDLEPYSVFRNEITLSTPQCAPVDTAAPDFFSLDVTADEPDPILSSLSSVRLAEPWTPLYQSEPTTPALEVEPKLESGWFRGHCKFKSPMLQLHKEIVDFCDFLSPTPEEQESRSAAVQRVSDLIKYIFPRSKVLFFSYVLVSANVQGAVSKWPPLRPLCLILKVFLQQRELNEVYSGGLGSYALLTISGGSTVGSLGSRDPLEAMEATLETPWS